MFIVLTNYQLTRAFSHFFFYITQITTHGKNLLDNKMSFKELNCTN